MGNGTISAVSVPLRGRISCSILCAPFLVAGGVMQLWLTSGTTMALIKVARGEPAEIGDLGGGGPFVLRILGASLLYTLVALVIVAGCLVPAGIMG